MIESKFGTFKHDHDRRRFRKHEFVMCSLDLWASVIHHRVYGGGAGYPSATECLGILREEPQYLTVDKICDRSDELYDCTMNKYERAKRLQIPFDADTQAGFLGVETYLVDMCAKRGLIALVLHCHPTTGRYQPAAVGRALAIKDEFVARNETHPSLNHFGDENVFRSFRPKFWFEDILFDEQRRAKKEKELCALGRRPRKTEHFERLVDQLLNVLYRDLVEDLAVLLTHGSMPSDVNRLIRMRQKEA